MIRLRFFDRNVTGVAHESPFKYALSWLLWPLLFSSCMVITAYGFSIDRPQLFFNIAYGFLILATFLLERYLPHEENWRRPDGQILTDLAHTLTSKGAVQALLLVNGMIGLADMVDGKGLVGYSLWPTQWPLWGQVVLAVVVSEFGLYWAHRLSHEIPAIWNFHAIHHSVKKLWFVNTGRFHIVDSLFSIIMGLLPLLALGAPLDMVKWVACVTAFIGMLTHCNIEMRFGPLSWIFNTPALHRWHHSMKLREGNKNYGENIMLWDVLFRTYFDENRRPPEKIGIQDYMPPKFRHQLLWPFLSKEKRDLLGR